MLKFEHEFEEEPRWGDLSVFTETPDGAKIEFSTGDEGIWVAANAEGFLHLARIFAELGTRKLEEGYHFHEPEWFKKSSDQDAKLEVSVELLHG